MQTQVAQGRMCTRKNLTLAFLHPDDDDLWINRAAALASSGMCHVELIFDSHTLPDASKSLAFSAQAGENVRLKHKTFGNPRYEYVTLAVSADEYDKAYQSAERAHNAHLAFSDRDMTLSLVHPGGCAHVPSSALGRSFCTKIITEALQHAGCDEVDAICPSRATPGRLYEAVAKSKRRVTTCIKFNSDKPPPLQMRR